MEQHQQQHVPVVDEQVRLLDDARKKVKEQGFYMKRAMDSEDLKGALNFASDMLRELRSSLLTPRNYYELYMKVLDELHHLDDYFFMLVDTGKKEASELYEEVQACGNVLPRLYLLITVGATYIKSKQAPAKDILNDLVEMAKGVQHPLRGLFLRNYLAHACRDKLPDVIASDNGGGDVSHAIDFVLANFSETNRLWVRMQNQGALKDRKRREKERQELRILVGTNLVRLSQLEAVDVTRYAELVLPRLLEQVVNCKDAIAQPYLLDCIIQVFPDEFHLATLDAFLETCSLLKEKVNVREILESMMTRLAAGARDATEDTPRPEGAFESFNAASAKMGTTWAVGEVLRLQVALLNFAVECYPARLDYINQCFATCAAILAEQKRPLDEEEAEQLEILLSSPMNNRSLGLAELLDLTLLGELLEYLPWQRRREVAKAVARAVLKTGSPLDSIDSLERLFSMIQPLLKDPPTDDVPAPISESELESEQLLVSRLAHLIKHESTDDLFRIFGAARRHFGQGGLSRIRFTLVPLVFRALDLAGKVRTLEDQVAAQQKRIETPPAPPTEEEEEAAPPAEDEDEEEKTVVEGEEEEAAPKEEEAPPPPVVEEEPLLLLEPPQYSSRKVFQFVHEIVTAMAGSFPVLSLKLFLQCAQCADRCGFSAIAYEFVSQAFILYEDELPDSKAQLKALASMIGTLLASTGFEDADYDALATKTTQYCAKLLKKPDQCRMVATCSHLFWLTDPSDDDDADAVKKHRYRDPKRVLECLQRSIKIADVCMTSSSSHIHLFVEILDHYLTHFEKKSPAVTEKYIAGLVELINAHVENMEPSGSRQGVEAHYRNTLKRIRKKGILAD